MIEGSESGAGQSVLTYGMVGGGQGAFIGEVHRKAVAMDGMARLTAGCFSQSYENTRETGNKLGLDSERLYQDYSRMAEAEGKRNDGIDFVSIVTPNNTHYPIARAFLEQNIHVVCDKPLTTNSRDAADLQRIASERALLFCVNYAYTGYPIVRHIREMIRKGDLGEIRFVNAEYPQDWLATPLEETGQKQSVWRNDPEQAGISNCVGDIGSHMENMVSFTTGLKIDSICARLDTFIEGRPLDDNASIMVNFNNGARGIYWSSQIALGHDNGLKIRIYGSKAGVEWAQENPNYMKIARLGKATEMISRGRDDLYTAAQSFSRIPSGHPEGYFEAFANIYSLYITALGKKLNGEDLTDSDLDFPGLAEGINGVRFIEKCVESSNKQSVWLKFE